MNPIKRAAELLRQEADCIRESHTTPPEFTDWTDELAAKAEHDEMLTVAAELERRCSAQSETPPRTQADIGKLVDRFLSWPLPDSVCSDGCVTERDYGKAQGWPKRVGTNLLTADEARQMLEYVLAPSAAPDLLDAFLEHAQEHGLESEEQLQAGVRAASAARTETLPLREDFLRRVMDAVRRHGSAMSNAEIIHMIAVGGPVTETAPRKP